MSCPQLLLVLSVLTTRVSVLESTLEAYEGPAPASNVSPIFSVKLTQSSSNRVAYPHVYYSKVNNAYAGSSLFYDQTISWVEFGQLSTDAITVEVCLLNAHQKGTFVDGSYSMLPLEYNITASNLKLLNNTCIAIALDRSIGNRKHMSLQYTSTATNSFMDAFYIFIGDLDPSVNEKDPHVLYFGPGTHNINGGSAKNTILSTGSLTTVYMARGAWVYGKIEITGSGSQTVNILGHGVLDGSGFSYANRGNNRIDGAAMLTVSNWNKAVNLSGMTCFNPSIYCANCMSAHSRVDQYRVLGWYYQNDGIGMGPDGVLSNSFFRTNDDSVKHYCGGPQTVTNIVVDQMYNGSPFQLGWNGVGCKGCSIYNSTVMHAWWFDENSGQNSVIDLDYSWPAGQVSDAKWTDILFENIRVDTAVGRLFSLYLDNQFANGGTTVQNIQVNNLQAKEKCHWYHDNNNKIPIQNWIWVATNNGLSWVNGVHFQDLSVDGQKITNGNNALWNMQFYGDTKEISDVTYS